MGDAIWPGVGAKDSRYQVNLGCRWIASNTDNDDSRAVMNGDLAPGAETQMTLVVHAPPTPGEYTLEVDMVHEGVTWFSQRGGRPLRLKMTVAP